MDAQARIDQLLKEYLGEGTSPKKETTPEEAVSKVPQETPNEQQALQNPPVEVETGGLVWPIGHYPHLNQEQAKQIRAYLSRQKGAPIDSIALHCRKHECLYRHGCPLYQIDPNLVPEGKSCHPPGTLIKTVGHGEVAIEFLDPTVHRLIGWDRKSISARPGRGARGFGFSVSQRHYSGELLSITAGRFSHEVTPEHISVARFNSKSLGKFCVYLMRKGNHWRIGKTKIAREYAKSPKSRHKTHLVFPMRALKEGADAMWILELFDTNTEALLAEEKYSLSSNTSRVSFADSLGRIKSKYNGMYKWATKEQINAHHESLRKDESFYRNFLSSIGRSIDYPIWSREQTNGPETRLYVTWPIYIRSCNLISEIMDVPVLSREIKDMPRFPGCLYSTDWETCKIEHRPYEGTVYSLAVDRFKTYFASNIATHNCPIELTLLQTMLYDFATQLEITEDNVIDLAILKEFVMWQIYAKRAREELAMDPQIVRKEFVGADSRGNVLTRENMHPAFIMLDKQSRTKQKLLESLLATREAKAKAANTSIPTFAAFLKSVQDRIDEKQRLKEAGVTEVTSVEHKVLTAPEDLED